MKATHQQLAAIRRIKEERTDRKINKLKDQIEKWMEPDPVRPIPKRKTFQERLAEELEKREQAKKENL